jgi:RNAse (barnase) inhibitor barstar
MSTTTVAQILSCGRSGVYRVAGRIDPSRLTGLSRLKGLRVCYVDCRRAQAKPTFLRAVAAALDFPDYFGMNWDALADCLTDLEWLDSDGVVLVLRGTTGFAARAPQDFDIALDVLAEAADYWAQEGAPFVVLIEEEDKPALAGLPVLSAR